jgi:hypothetical protein
VIRIPSTVDERDPTVTGSLHELLDGILLSLELGEITFLELLPTFQIVAEPLSQPGRGSDLFPPLIEIELVLGDATGPHPIDKDSVAVASSGRVISASDLNVHRRLLLESGGPQAAPS